MRLNLLIATLSSLLFNTAIAGLLTVVGFGGGFWINFVYSQCIGFSIFAINSTAMWRISGLRLRWAVALVAFPGSILIGITAATWITGSAGWSDPRTWVAVVISLFFGSIGFGGFFLGMRIRTLDAEVRQRRLNEVESEKRQTTAQLKMLQAQIEPHFLFNTLANVSSLIDSDPALAKSLLEHLNDWLRVALARARSGTTTLGDELDMLENYLQILKIRFGERLRWRIEVPEDARLSVFPPMLLQPLVENAVRHGIEPKLGGGDLVIRARRENARLALEVRDSGVGLQDMQAAGAGLENVRARLATLFGEDGRLTLENNPDGGATATLELPQ